LLPYNDLDELLYLCVKVEQQLKRKNAHKKEYSTPSQPYHELKMEGYSSNSTSRSEGSLDRDMEGKI